MAKATTPRKKANSASIVQNELSIEIEAPPKKVWKALVSQTSSWWSRDFYALQSSQRMTLEPKVGGRFFEESEAGAGVLWFTVLAIDPPRSLTLAGYLVPPYAGPGTTLLHLSLEDLGEKGTLLRVLDSVIGQVDEESAACQADGWQTLFSQGLKAFVEG